MGLFDWLTGKFGSSRPSNDPNWGVSENGNPTLVSEQVRVTVFAQDGGWTFCIADLDDQTRPFFSESYMSEADARGAAIAYLRGETSVHQTFSDVARTRRRDIAETSISHRENLIAQLQNVLAADPGKGIMHLRQPEKKIATQLKSLAWGLRQYDRDGVSDALIAKAELQQTMLMEMQADVEQRIASRMRARPAPNEAAEKSTLESSVAEKVDALIRLFNDAPKLEETERRRRLKATIEAAMAAMTGAGAAYGEASGDPNFTGLDDAAHRAFIKKTDQDLDWQCGAVRAAFVHYQRSGEIPAPHFPMRIAILLRKADDIDREKRFLSAWCRHFPTGNGQTYEDLVLRARKLGALAQGEH